MTPEQFYRNLEVKQRIIESHMNNNCHPAGNASLFEECKSFDVIDINRPFNGSIGKNARHT